MKATRGKSHRSYLAVRGVKKSESVFRLFLKTILGLEKQKRELFHIFFKVFSGKNLKMIKKLTFCKNSEHAEKSKNSTKTLKKLWSEKGNATKMQLLLCVGRGQRVEKTLTVSLKKL